jgi:anti-anti-sigma factor
MQYTLSADKASATIAISGRLTFTDAPAFPKLLDELAATGTTSWRFDLSGLEFIDSTGMSLFVHIYDAAQAKDLSVTITGTAGGAGHTLMGAGFKELFKFQ